MASLQEQKAPPAPTNHKLLNILKNALHTCRSHSHDSKGAKAIFKLIREATSKLAASTTPMEAMEGDPMLYEALLLASSSLNRRGQMPSFCGLCWRTTVPTLPKHRSKLGETIPVAIAGSHIEPDCLLKEFDAFWCETRFGSNKAKGFIVNGQAVGSDKLKSPLCCRTHEKADSKTFATCEVVTGCDEGQLTVFKRQLEHPAEGHTYPYGRWLWVAVAAVIWRRLVFAFEHYCQDNDAKDGLLLLEKSLRSFLCSLMEHKNAALADATSPPAAAAAPTFRLFVTAAPEPAKVDSMLNIFLYREVNAVVRPLPIGNGKSVPFVGCFTVFNLHFVACANDAAEVMDSSKQRNTTWIELKWPADSKEELPLEIPASPDRHCHPDILKLIEAEALHMTMQTQSTNESPAIKSLRQRAAKHAPAQDPGPTQYVEAQLGHRLYMLPSFIKYRHGGPSFGKFIYGEERTVELQFRLSVPSRTGFIEITRLVGKNAKVDNNRAY